MRTENFDPLAYIESAFLDTNPRTPVVEDDVEHLDLSLPSLADYMGNGASELLLRPPSKQPAESKARFRKTVMSAPRPRKTKGRAKTEPIDPDLQTVWTSLPKNVAFLCSFFDDSVTSNYYRGTFKESRQELIRRLLDPELSLEETSRLLGVCPATIRRYTNRGWLAHHRTVGGQRRFRLGDIVRFVDEHGRLPQE